MLTILTVSALELLVLSVVPSGERPAVGGALVGAAAAVLVALTLVEATARPGCALTSPRTALVHRPHPGGLPLGGGPPPAGRPGRAEPQLPVHRLGLRHPGLRPEVDRPAPRPRHRQRPSARSRGSEKSVQPTSRTVGPAEFQAPIVAVNEPPCGRSRSSPGGSYARSSTPPALDLLVADGCAVRALTSPATRRTWLRCSCSPGGAVVLRGAHVQDGPIAAESRKPPVAPAPSFRDWVLDHANTFQGAC